MNVTDAEANEILKEFVYLRDKYRTSKSKSLHTKYQRQIELCAQKFDYIVLNKAKRYRSFSNYDDLVQDGRLALMLALDSYQLDKGSWFWWANQYIKTKISREANRHSTIKIPLKKAREMTPYKVSQMPVLTDNAESALSNMESSERLDIINLAVLNLPCTQRKIIQMYYDLDINNHNKKNIHCIRKELNLSIHEFKDHLMQAQSNLKEKLACINELC